MDLLNGHAMRGIWCALVTFATAAAVYALTDDGRRNTQLGHGFVFALFMALLLAGLGFVVYKLARRRLHISALTAVLSIVAAVLVGSLWVRLKAMTVDLGWWTTPGFCAWLVVFADLGFCAWLTHSLKGDKSK